MADKHPVIAPDMPDVEALVHLIGSIFADINLGLIIYHLEDPAEPHSLRMVYVNEEASRYTGADLSAFVGLTILEAFPNLGETELPETYARVAVEKKPKQLGTIQYGDDNLEPSYYAVKAFPMPNGCVGILFENITLRKKVSEKVRHRTEHLSEQNKALSARVAETSTKLGDVLRRFEETIATLAQDESDLAETSRARLAALSEDIREAQQLVTTLTTPERS